MCVWAVILRRVLTAVIPHILNEVTCLWFKDKTRRINHLSGSWSLYIKLKACSEYLVGIGDTHGKWSQSWGPFHALGKETSKTCFMAAHFHLGSQDVHQHCSEEPLKRAYSREVKGSRERSQDTHCPLKRTLSAHKPARLLSPSPGREAPSLTGLPTWGWPTEPWSRHFSSQLAKTESPAPGCLSCDWVFRPMVYFHHEQRSKPSLDHSYPWLMHRGASLKHLKS